MAERKREKDNFIDVKIGLKNVSEFSLFSIKARWWMLMSTENGCRKREKKRKENNAENGTIDEMLS